MIVIKNLCKSFGDRAALSGVDLVLPDTGLIAIEGKCGSGKTTLLRLLTGQLIPDAGSVEVGGVHGGADVYFACVEQDNRLFDELTAGENLLPFGTRDEVADVAARLALTGVLKRKASKLSGGERRRVCVARALLQDAPVLAADEATANLDAENAERILTLLKERAKYGLVLLVTHDTARADRFADRVIRLDGGKVVADSGPQASERGALPPRKRAFRMPVGAIGRIAAERAKRGVAQMLFSVFACAMLGAIFAGLIGFAGMKTSENYFRTLDSSLQSPLTTKEGDAVTRAQYEDLRGYGVRGAYRFDGSAYGIAYLFLDEAMPNGAIGVTDLTESALRKRGLSDGKTLTLDGKTLQIRRVVPTDGSGEAYTRALYMNEADALALLRTDTLLLTDDNYISLTIGWNAELAEGEALASDRFVSSLLAGGKDLTVGADGLRVCKRFATYGGTETLTVKVIGRTKNDADLIVSPAAYERLWKADLRFEALVSGGDRALLRALSELGYLPLGKAYSAFSALETIRTKWLWAILSAAAIVFALYAAVTAAGVRHVFAQDRQLNALLRAQRIAAADRRKLSLLRTLPAWLCGVGFSVVLFAIGAWIAAKKFAEQLIFLNISAGVGVFLGAATLAYALAFFVSQRRAKRVCGEERRKRGAKTLRHNARDD